MDEEDAGLVNNVELDVMATLVDDAKDLVFIQKNQPDLLAQNEIEVMEDQKVCVENESIDTEEINIKEHCIMDVSGMATPSKTEVDETPFDAISSSRPLDQFDLDQAEAEVTLAGGRPVQLPDGTYGVIKHLTHMSDGFQFVSLEDGTLAWLPVGMFAADGSISADQLELDAIDVQTDTASVNEENEEQADAVMDEISVINANHGASVDEVLPGTSVLLHKTVGRDRSGLMASEPSEKTFKCMYEGCGRLYTTQHHLRVHQRSHTGDRPYLCNFDGCSKAFSTSYGLKSHRRIHTGEKPYICTLDGCEKAFKTSGDLQKHTRTHTGEKPFMCPYEGCNRSFTTSNIRKVHIRTHTGERPYTCDVVGCGKTFASATNYKNHIRIHSGEKPYVCTWDGCGKRFTEYSSLYKHHVVHTHTKPYECADCGKTYRQTSTLAIHRRMAHGENSHAESTTLVQSAATAFIVTSNTLCNHSGEVLIEKQPPILSLRLVDDSGRSTVEDSDGHLIIDTSDRQHHILSGEGLQIISSDCHNVTLDTVAMVASSATSSASEVYTRQEAGTGRVYVITNPLHLDSLTLQTISQS